MNNQLILSDDYQSQSWSTQPYSNSIDDDYYFYYSDDDYDTYKDEFAPIRQYHDQHDLYEYHDNHNHHHHHHNHGQHQHSPETQTSSSSSSSHYLHNNNSMQSIPITVFLWILLLVLYLYDERKTRDRLERERRMGLVEEEEEEESMEGGRGSRSRSMDPEKRRMEIGEWIESREIRSSNEAKSLLSTLETDTDTEDSPHHTLFTPPPPPPPPLSSSSQTITTTSTPSPPCLSDTEEPTCSICLEHFSPGDNISWAKLHPTCRHVFHADCLLPWLMEHDECPYCRTTLLPPPLPSSSSSSSSPDSDDGEVNVENNTNNGELGSTIAATTVPMVSAVENGPDTVRDVDPSDEREGLTLFPMHGGGRMVGELGGGGGGEGGWWRWRIQRIRSRWVGGVEEDEENGGGGGDEGADNERNEP